MLAAVTLMLAAATGLQQRTDTTFAAPAGARLELHDFSGTVHVGTWDRAEVRVRADHGSRDHIRIEVRGGVIRVQADRERGHPTDIDYEVTVPRTMGVDVDGTETDITVESVGGDLRVASVNGDITVRNAGGAVLLTSTEGDIQLDGGRGTIRVTGIEGDVGISRARGEITVETVEGDVTLDGVESENVDISTVEGDITYRGTVRDNGSYRLTTHEGDVTLSVATPLDATVSVATFEGSFEAAPEFGLTLSPGRHGNRRSFMVGSGAARIELESCAGAIPLERR
jgi:DUF4097 and DUF4098 domain-containing protein YvlB